MARSGRRAPSVAPMPIATASATTIPAVEPSRVSIGSSVAASVTVASVLYDRANASTGSLGPTRSRRS